MEELTAIVLEGVNEFIVLSPRDFDFCELCSWLSCVQVLRMLCNCHQRENSIIIESLADKVDFSDGEYALTLQQADQSLL